MKKNVTRIRNDKDFLKCIEELIDYYREDDFLLEKLISIKDIANGNEFLKKEQKKYLSLQRVLDDMGFGHSDIENKFYEMIYYFAYIYKIPNLGKE